jgi:GNAT superfamily N-acetyltransferase
MPRLVAFDERHTNGVIALIGGVFAEYGLTFDPAGYDADLTRILGTYCRAGGAFWVLEEDGRVVGTIGVSALSSSEVEIKRVYLDASLRGQGLGRALVEHVMSWAAERGYTQVCLWSDVKFERSHVMYERLGFARTGLRDCDDIDQSKEYRFEKPLSSLATTSR